MENFNYNVIIHNNGNEIVIKTNDVTYAIREFLRADDAGCNACLCNGYTGEVLCHNGDEPYCTNEMALMVLGYLCAEQWGEPADEPHIVPADGVVADPAVALLSAMFGIPADEVVARHNHTDDNPLEEVLTAITNAVAGPLGAVMALPSPDGGLDVFPYLPPNPKGLPS